MSDSRHFSIPLKGERVGFRGFTLIELVVVMALIAIMMALAIPNLQHILTDDTRKASQWILVQVPRLKSRAVSEGKIYTLHADMDGNMLWISNDGMSDEELSQAKKKGFALSDSIFLLDVTYADGDIIDSGEASIRFYPKGYSDMVILHLGENNGNKRSFLIEPFLSQVELKEEYVDFEG